MKEQMRKDFLKTRNDVERDCVIKWSEKISETLFSLEQYKKAQRVFIYVSIGNEVDTRHIIEMVLCSGKKVAVPIALKNRKMIFCQVEGIAGLKKSTRGIPEPDIEKNAECSPERDDLFIVPGVVFDENMGRMGYGGGFYDTYILDYNVKNKIALAFEIQVQHNILLEEHDQRMDIIITEKRIIEKRDFHEWID